jgi:triosephosphate isomerase
MTRRPLIAGNWKMFGFRADLGEIEALAAAIGDATERIDVAICPPATLIAQAVAARRGAVAIGAQDCHISAQGAYTGDISAAQLADAGARFVILGHSERRQGHGETDALVRAKTGAAVAAGLEPIVCIGETLEQRKAGQAETVVSRQLRGSLPDAAPEGQVIAYEPVWAIGTGLTPELHEIGEIHRLIHRELAQRFGETSVRVLYGGSVKPANAAEIFRIDGVDGALVGGASLKAADFSAIVLAHPAAREGNRQ